MYCTSFAIWPNGARDWWSLFKVFMMSWESPFIITQSIPSFAANSTALRATSAFTSVIVKGRGIYWEREAITKPLSFCITSPILAQCSFSNRAPLKLTLYHCGVGGCHDSRGWPQCKIGAGCPFENSWIRSLACWSSFPSDTIPLARHRLFLLFHKVQATIEKSVGSLLSAKMHSSRSIKLLHCFRLWWFQRGIDCHNFVSIRQRYKAWWMSSVIVLHWLHLSFVMTLYLTRLFLEGREFLHALHTRFLSLLGTCNCHIALHWGFIVSELEGPRFALWRFVRRNWYLDFTVYSSSAVKAKN